MSWHELAICSCDTGQCNPVLTAVNWPYYKCPINKMWTCQDTPETPLPPFWWSPLSHPICRRVRTYARSVNHVTTKRKEVDHIPWVWGSVPRALCSPTIKTTPFKGQLCLTGLPWCDRQYSQYRLITFPSLFAVFTCSFSDNISVFSSDILGSVSCKLCPTASFG